MAITQVYPPITISAAGLATEATLGDILTSTQNIEANMSMTALYNFFEEPNTITGSYQTVWTVAGSAVKKITVKQNDGNNISIGVNGVEKLVCPPSGEVQHYDLEAPIGAVIAYKAIGTPSNAGAIDIAFFG